MILNSYVGINVNDLNYANEEKNNFNSIINIKHSEIEDFIMLLNSYCEYYDKNIIHVDFENLIDYLMDNEYNNLLSFTSDFDSIFDKIEEYSKLSHNLNNKNKNALFCIYVPSDVNLNSVDAILEACKEKFELDYMIISVPKKSEFINEYKIIALMGSNIN